MSVGAHTQIDGHTWLRCAPRRVKLAADEITSVKATYVDDRNDCNGNLITFFHEVAQWRVFPNSHEAKVNEWNSLNLTFYRSLLSLI